MQNSESHAKELLGSTLKIPYFIDADISKLHRKRYSHMQNMSGARHLGSELLNCIRNVSITDVKSSFVAGRNQALVSFVFIDNKCKKDPTQVLLFAFH